MDELFPKEGEICILKSPNGSSAEVRVVKVDLNKRYVSYTGQGSQGTQDIELHRFCSHFQPKNPCSTPVLDNQFATQ